MMRPPALSVILATGAPAADREACLAALSRQQSAEPFDVIESPIDEGDLGRAWNRGAERAAGAVLVFLRDDLIPSATFVAESLRHCRASPHGVVIERTHLAADVSGFAKYYGEHAGAESPLAACAGRPLAMSRTCFMANGGFAAGLEWGTDVEFALRATWQGTPLVHTTESLAERRLPRTFRGVAALLDAEGQSSVELYRRHPALLPSLKLGAFADASEGALALRRTLLGLRGVVPLRWVERMLPIGRRDAWYRFLSGCLYWRGVRRALGNRDLWRRLTRGPVILMYHAIGDRNDSAGCYVVPFGRFVRQMRWLKLAGYRVLPMEELLRHRRDHRLPPARSVAITFDDGYLDNATRATPVLERLGLTATFYLVTGRLGARNDWDREGELAGRPLLSWADARRMLDAGMSVGAHTRTHPALPSLSTEEAAAEIEGARQDLMRELGITAVSFAYPYGRLDDTVRAAVARAGYRAACCSRSGVNDPVVASFLLRRLEVRGTDSLFHFARAVRRGRARRKRSTT